MNASLYVLDIETTDLEPQKGRIVEVGVARVDLYRWKVYPEYGRVVNVRIRPEEHMAWVFKNTDLKPDEVESSPYSGWSVATDISNMMHRGVFTSYFHGFDFYWLEEKWNLHPEKTLDIKDMVETHYGRRLTAQAAYRYYCPENPARLPQLTEDHRALSDAVMESYILLALCKEMPDAAAKILNDLVRE